MNEGSKATVTIIHETADTIANRGETHGDAYKQQCVLANLWSAMLGTPVSPAEAALMQLMIKVSRIVVGDANELDHYRDVIGYAGIAAMCAQRDGAVDGGVTTVGSAPMRVRTERYVADMMKIFGQDLSAEKTEAVVTELIDAMTPEPK